MQVTMTWTTWLFTLKGVQVRHVNWSFMPLFIQQIRNKKLKFNKNIIPELVTAVYGKTVM